MTSEAFTAEELTAFSTKLDGWSKTLDGREQTLLRGLVGLAAWGAQHDEAAEEGNGVCLSRPLRTPSSMSSSASSPASSSASSSGSGRPPSTWSPWQQLERKARWD